MQSKKYILGIDASNIRSGGGVTHLVEFVSCLSDSKSEIQNVIIFSSKKTLNKIHSYPTIIKCTSFLIDINFIFAFIWQFIFSGFYFRKYNCDLLLVPGGIYFGNFSRYVAISQNILPFLPESLKSYKGNLLLYKYYLIRYAQLYTFSHAKGVIFLTEYSRDVIKPFCNFNFYSTVIPHGISPAFMKLPEANSQIDHKQTKKKIKLLYVSRFEPYKHQNEVILAFLELSSLYSNLELTLVGQVENEIYYKQLLKNCKKSQNINIYINFEYNEIRKIYHESDIFIFASECENLPIILLEAIASNLTIVSSDRRPMTDILGSNAHYLEPNSVDSIKNALLDAIHNPKYYNREDLLILNGHKLNWNNTTNSTIEFLLKSCIH